MVQAQIVAMIRREVALFLNQRARIERETAARGVYGEPLHGWEIVSENVPCRIIKLGRRNDSAIAEAGSAETMRDEYRLIVSRSTPLGADMRVVIDGLQYGVVRIETALADEAFHAAIVNRRE